MGSAVIAAMFAMGACSGSKVTDPNAGSGDEGGAPSSEAGGSTSTATGGAATAQGGASTTATGTGAKTPFECKKGDPAGPDIAPGTNGTWGSQGSISGGTFFYQKADTEKFTADFTTAPGSVTLAATVAPNDYTGFGVYFKDPAKCWNLSKYTGGVKMTLSGNLGGGTLAFQIQQNSNYPIDTTNSKGACEGDWGDPCNNFESDPITISTTPTEISIPWTQFTKGSPVTALDTAQLLGFQWQINCPTADPCTPSLTIGAVTLY
jgi:hypothetical protein